MKTPGQDIGASGWDAYWRHTREAAAHQGGGPQDQVLGGFWNTLFLEFLPRHPHARLLDVACGNGAVTEYALRAAQQLGRAQPIIYALDRSLPALAQWRQRFSSTTGVVADAARAPFADQRFQLVASQFGIEYAGIQALAEAARLVAGNGAFAAVLHLKGGGIYRECRTNLQAVNGVRRCELLPRMADLFRAGDGGQVRSRRARIRQAEGRLTVAMNVLQQTLSRKGHDVAGGALARLQADVVHMSQHRDVFEPRAVTEWAERMARELAAYGERMATMLRAAADDATVDEMTARLTAGGLQLRIREQLVMGPDRAPAAWALVCERPGLRQGAAGPFP